MVSEISFMNPMLIVKLIGLRGNKRAREMIFIKTTNIKEIT